MIVRPFLRDQCDGPMVVHNSTNSTLERNRTILNTTTVYKVLKEPVTVQYGYWIIASIQVGVVWCGVVWCGACGVVWCGVVWCGVVWCSGVGCGGVWCGGVWWGVVGCGGVRCGAVWCG